MWRSIDHLFFTILVASLVVHFSGAACIVLSPKPPDADLALDDLPDRFARVLLPPKPPEPEVKKEEVAKGEEEPKKDVKKDAKKDPSRSTPRSARTRSRPRWPARAC